MQGAKKRLKRRFSLSDRIRYYWPYPQVQSALERLFRNLQARPIPATLISQYFPQAYPLVRAGVLEALPEHLLRYAVYTVLDRYMDASRP